VIENNYEIITKGKKLIIFIGDFEMNEIFRFINKEKPWL